MAETIAHWRERVPYVPYESALDFKAEWDRCIWAYVAMLHRLLDEFEQEYPAGHTPRKLIWTRFDLLMLGLCDFREVLERGLPLLELATKHKSTQWCILINEHLRTRVCTACRVYVQSVRHHRTNPDMWFLRSLLRGEVEDVLHVSSESICEFAADWSPYPHESLNPVFSPISLLFERNFLRKFCANGDPWLVCHVDVWHAMLFAIMAATHARLGSASALGLLEPELLVQICKML